jgi:flagellar biosynthetic protein FlhB
VAENQEKEQKSEEATPRRRQEAREKGQVPLSMELLAALLLAGWMVAFAVYGSSLAEAAGGVLRSTLSSLGTLGTGELDLVDFVGVLNGAARASGSALAAFLLPLLLLGVLVGYGQIGFQITPKAVAFDGAKLDPIKGLGRLFSVRSVVRTSLALAKIVLIGAVMAIIAWTQIDEITRLDGLDVGPVLAGIGYVALRCVAGALVTIVALALIDVAFQRFQHGVDLRMTKQEVKDELKSTEGDPHLRGRIRRVQREMASRRMMADVPEATVVVTNPTHYAVALRYDDDERESRSAPRVVAKGVDFVAQRIKEIAHENDVICYEDVQLARALHAQCEIGDEIPLDLYQAVASVLAYVYGLQGDKHEMVTANG